MFTGLVSDLGTVTAVRRGNPTRFTVSPSAPLNGLEIGASICHDGCCLTAVSFGDGTWDVEASTETLSLTTLDRWQVGTKVNLERSLRMGDELGGHIVTGHVDGTATLVEHWEEDGSHRLVFDAPRPLAGYIARKGSVALSGISLTVNEVEGTRFGVNIIPHTWSVTTLSNLSVGHPINLEVDILARYVARQAEMA